MRYARMLAIATALLLLAGGSATPARADVSFGFFYSNLEPHGSWHVSAQYGQVWQPAVYNPQWNPYYDGHWVYTDVGWTWVSDYGWGAIPYHYGTWVADPYLGWVWVPGYTWAPSWVVFRTGPDYIGWAPVPPTFRVGVSFRFGDPTPGAFVFVSSRDFLAPRIRTCAYPESRTRVIINRTTIVNNVRVENNVVVNRGPDPRVIERASGRKVRAERIESVPRATPERRFNRDAIRVDARRERQGVRAAEPASNRLSTAGAPDDRRAPREAVKQQPSREEARPQSAMPKREAVAPRSEVKPKPSRDEARPQPAAPKREAVAPRSQVKPKPSREEARPQSAAPKHESVAPRSQVKPSPRPGEQPKGTANRPPRKPAEKKGKAQEKQGTEKKGEESKGESQGSSGDRPAHERSQGNRGVS